MAGSGKSYNIKVWEEKVFDAVNYLLLFWAVLNDSTVNNAPHNIVEGERGV